MISVINVTRTIICHMIYTCISLCWKLHQILTVKLTVKFLWLTPVPSLMCKLFSVGGKNSQDLTAEPLAERSFFEKKFRGESNATRLIFFIGNFGFFIFILFIFRFVVQGGFVAQSRYLTLRGHPTLLISFIFSSLVHSFSHSQRLFTNRFQLRSVWKWIHLTLFY